VWAKEPTEAGLLPEKGQGTQESKAPFHNKRGAITRSRFFVLT
jgi:hypothetical protein